MEIAFAKQLSVYKRKQPAAKLNDEENPMPGRMAKIFGRAKTEIDMLLCFDEEHTNSTAIGVRERHGDCPSRKCHPTAKSMI
jgi:hypothetical protein